MKYTSQCLCSWTVPSTWTLDLARGHPQMVRKQSIGGGGAGIGRGTLYVGNSAKSIIVSGWSPVGSPDSNVCPSEQSSSLREHGCMEE